MPNPRNLLKRVEKLEAMGVRDPVEMSPMEVMFRVLNILNSEKPEDAAIKSDVQQIIGDIEHEPTQLK